MPNETCDRCGNPGSDRRTLWMACFYAMDELDVQFKQASIHGQYCEQVGTKTTEFAGHKMRTPEFSEPSGETRHHSFFTLRVCKRCRSEWMQAIRDWFHAVPECDDNDAEYHEPNPQGTGVFVRENGSIQELSEEEVAKRFPPRH